MIKDNAKNSTSKQKRSPAENKNTKTNDITECTGFRELITKKAETNNKILKQKTKKFIVIFKINLTRKTGFEPAAFDVTGQYSNH